MNETGFDFCVRFWLLLQKAVKRRSLYGLATRHTNFGGEWRNRTPRTYTLAQFSRLLDRHWSPPSYEGQANLTLHVRKVKNDRRVKAVFMGGTIPC